MTIPLPGAWMGCAIAMLPVLEFVVRAQWGYQFASSFIAALWFGGTVIILAVSGMSGRVDVSGRSLPVWLAGIAIAPLLSMAANGRLALSLPDVTLVYTGLAVFMLALAGMAISGGRLSRMLAWGLMAGGGAAAAFGLWQSFVGFDDLLRASDSALGADAEIARKVRERLVEARAFSFFIYPNAFGGFMAMAIPPALELWRSFRESGRSGRTLASGMLVLLLLAGLLSSRSIGAVLALAAGLAFAAAFARDGARTGRVVLAAGALLVAVVLALRGPGALASGLGTKLVHWRSAVGACSSPRTILFGYGPGSYGDAAGGRMPEGLRSRSAHNWLVETWVENGAGGVLALAAFICAMTLVARRYVMRGGSWGIAAGWAAALIHSMADIDYSLPALAMPWWGLSGVMVAAAAMGKGKGRRTERGIAVPFGPVSAFLLSAAFVVIPLLNGAPARLATDLFLGAALALVLFTMMRGEGGRVWRPTDLPWICVVSAFVLWTGSSVSVADTYAATLRGAGLLAVLLLGRSAAGIGFIPWVLMAVGSFHGGWAAASLLTGEPARTTFASPNSLGAFLAGLLGPALWFWQAGALPGRWWGMLATALILAGLAGTRSAGALAAGAGVIAVFLFLKGKLSAGTRHLWWSGAAVVLLLMPHVAARVLESGSIGQRLVIWEEGLSALRAHPFGYGPGTYAAVSDSVRRPSATWAGIGRFSLRADFAHCDPLQAVVEWGIPVFALGLWGLLAAFGSCGVSGYGWMLGAVGIMLQGLVDFPAHIPAVAVLLAVAIGGMSAGTRKGRGRRPAWGVPAGLAALPLALVAAWTGVELARPALARMALSVPRSDVPAEIAIARRALAAFPASPAAHEREAWAWFAVGAGSGKRAAGAFALAEESSRLAANLDGPACRLSTGLMLLERHRFTGSRADLAGARRELGMAAAAAPNSYLPPLLAAYAWERQRNYRMALAALGEVMRIEPLNLAAMSEIGRIQEISGDRAAARRTYRRVLLLRPLLEQRGGLNSYEEMLLAPDMKDIRIRLLDLATDR